MSGNISFDDSKFQEALEAYMQYTRRDLPSVINKVAKDIALTAAKGLKEKKEGTQTAIANLAETDWWIKYVSKMVASGNAKGKPKFKKKKDGTTVRIETEWNKKLSQVAKRMLAVRKSSVSLLASGYAKAGNSFKGGGGTQSLSFMGGKLDKARGSGRPAVPSDKPEATLEIGYDVEHRQGAVDYAYPYLKQAIQDKTADLWEYVRKKMKDNGQAVSGKGK